MDQTPDQTNIHPQSGNRLFPLSPKAIRLLRAHDLAVAHADSPVQGTGGMKRVSD